MKYCIVIDFDISGETTPIIFEVDADNNDDAINLAIEQMNTKYVVCSCSEITKDELQRTMESEGFNATPDETY